MPPKRKAAAAATATVTTGNAATTRPRRAAAQKTAAKQATAATAVSDDDDIPPKKRAKKSKDADDAGNATKSDGDKKKMVRTNTPYTAISHCFVGHCGEKRKWCSSRFQIQQDTFASSQPKLLRPSNPCQCPTKSLKLKAMSGTRL
jgi:hypothetical protein